MSFLTLRNTKWTGGDVTISDDGRYIVVEMRDVVPRHGYVLIDLVTGEVVKGQQWSTLFEAQKAAERLRKSNQPKKGT